MSYLNVFPRPVEISRAQKTRKGPPMTYHEKYVHWKDVCSIHWKEIVTLSVALHWVMDMFIIGPIVFCLGVMFGLHLEH